MADYTINFLNGSSTLPATLPVGTYSFVSTTIPGYTDGTVGQFTITPLTTSVALSITANGTLQVTVEDDLGNPITAGALQLSDATGTTRYGDAETIVAGDVTFANVPYTASAIDFFIAQNGSDANHDPITTPQAVAMTQQIQDETILNARKQVSVNFTMDDGNYAGISPITGGLTVNG